VGVRPSARKHGIEGTDIEHAWVDAMRLVEYGYQGEDRLLVNEPDRHGGSSTRTGYDRSSTTF
jgi:hypothetical protein